MLKIKEGEPLIFLIFLKLLMDTGKNMIRENYFDGRRKCLCPLQFITQRKSAMAAINDSSVKINFQYNSISIYWYKYFNDKNEIAQMKTERYIEILN